MDLDSTSNAIKKYILILGILFSFSTVKAQLNATDSLALVALYNATDGANWTDNTNWLTGTADTWFGVNDIVNDSIRIIDLSNNNLIGTLPVEVGNFTKIEEIHFFSSGLTGSIPTELSNLTTLKVLSLGSNTFTGSIPVELGSLPQLTHLYLSNNQLTGNMPQELGNLTNLIWLELGSNQLDGFIPIEIGNLSMLQHIDLSYNQLSGIIPTEFGNLTNLVDLFLYNNQLSGGIPSEIGNLLNLSALLLYDNQLSGNIPPELGNITNLNWVISLANNQLSGIIPPELGSMINMTELDLSNNQLTGSIPFEMGNLAQLENLWLQNNQLSGAVPDEIFNLAALIDLNLSNNLFGDTLPQNGTLLSLSSLDLSNNQFTGTLGSGWLIPNLISLNVGNNQLSGSIPPELGTIPTLQTLIMHQNQFSGTIPLELGGLANLTALVLHTNQLNGGVPQELGNLTQLVDLQLNDNLLTGAIPATFTNLINLQYVYLQNNQFDGLPDLSTLPIFSFSVANNNLTFEDLEANVGFPTSDYVPQADIPSASPFILNAGDTVNVTVPVAGSANLYQWLLDGDTIVNEFTDNLVRNGITGTDLGTYRLDVTNLLVPGLTIYSVPFTVSFDVPSNSCVAADTALVGNNTTPKAPYWFTYTALQPEILNFTTSAIGAVLNVYSDCSLSENLGGNNLYSNPNETLFLDTNETIKIHWDSINSPAGFNWNLEVKIPQTVLASDSLALVDFYNATGGPDWPYQNNWLTGWVESWLGVWSDGNGRVAGVSLFTNNIKGTIPASFLDLDKIEEIDFQGNLIENIPDFSQLDSLKTVQLYNNLLEFDDLEPLVGAFDSLVYIPQKDFGNGGHKLLKIGDNLNITHNVPGTGVSMGWERDDVPLPNDTLATVSITNFQDSLAGRYNLRATSTLVPGLVLASNGYLLEVDSTTLTNTTYFEWVTIGAIVEDIPQNTYGSSWIDYDNDGDEDLYVNHWLGTVTEPNYLYQNNGDGTFTKVTSGTISEIFAQRFVSWGDYNNDGMVDMICHISNGSNLAIYQNQGGGVFTEIIIQSNLNGRGAIFGDVNGDGNLDIVHSSWPDTEILIGDGVGGFNSSGAFTSQLSDANIQVMDVDNDGDVDISMAYFGVTPHIFINDGTGSFTEQVIKNLSNVLATSWLDIENDGDMDAFIMNRNGVGEGYFMVNDGTGALDSIPMQDMLGESFFGRGSTTGDVNNDGYVDLISYNSNIGKTALFLNNQNSTFTQVPDSDQLFSSVGAAGGSSLADYDNDGALDLIVQEWGPANNELYHNKGNANNWLKLKLVGTYSNASAIGARVVASAGALSMTRQIQNLTGFTSSNSMLVHYGLASEATADITIYWPSGIVQTISGVAANQLLEVIEDCASPITWYADPDGDGRGDSEISLVSCVQPDGYVDNADDLRLAYYWVGDGGNWVDISHWSNTSGGPADHTNPPDLNDSVYFDVNSFSSVGQIVDVTDNGDDLGVDFGTMDWRGVTNFPTFQIRAVTSSWLMNYTHGSLYFSQDMTLDFHHAEFYFGSVDDYVLDTKGHHMGEDSFLDFGYGFGGSLTTNNTRCDIISDLNNVLVYLNTGQLHGNGNTIKGQKNHYFWIAGDSVLLDVSNSYVEIGGLIKSDTLSTFIDTDATLKVFDYFNGENLSLENVIISDSVEFRSYDYIIDTLEILSGAVVTLDTGTTVTINKLKAVGTVSNPITIQSSVLGTASNISQSSGVADAFNLNLIDNNAVGGAIFNAYRSTDGGGNTGWNFLSASVADSIALTAFYDQATGGDWIDNTNWTTGPVNTWFGIGIKGANVSSITLPANNLVGNVAPELTTITTLERLDLQDNFLETIPDLTELPTLDTLNVANNNLDFASLEANATIIEVDYTNQGEIGVPVDTVIYVGGNYKLVAETAGDSNTYQWKKIIGINVGDTINLEGKTTNTLYLDSLNRQSMGTFICEVNNTVVTDLTLLTGSNRILAGADITGLVKDTNGLALDSGIVNLFQVQIDAAFDTTAVFHLIPGDGGVFNFPKAVLADYIFLAKIDTISFPETLPTYWTSTIFWEEADTLKLNTNESNIEILVSATPPDDPGGEGEIFGVVFEDLPETGRLAKKRGLPKASVSVRRKRGASKGDETLEDIFDLIGYVTTDEDGNYSIDRLQAGLYRFNVQYPGIPMDTINSNVDIEVTDGGPGQKTQVIATVTADGIILESTALGIDRPYIEKRATAYPVPSSSILYIKLDSYRNMDVVLTVKSMTGQTISTEQRVISADDSSPIELDIHELETGIYIVEIQSKQSFRNGTLKWRSRFMKTEN